MSKLLIIFCLLLLINPLSAANQAREKLLANELIERIGENDVVWLKEDDRPFLALLSDHSSAKRRGGVILLHDLDAHPDWPEVISPLRLGLPDKGWPTLSLQLPLLSDDIELNGKNQQRIIDESNTRIAAAVEHFTNMGIYNIVMLGHGLGATAMSHFLSGNLKQNHAIYIKAFIAIRFRTHQDLPAEYSPDSLLKLKTDFPILDLLGTNESPLNQQKSSQRKVSAVQSQNPNYRQERVLSANNNFRGAEDFLLSRISGWLKVNASGAEVELEKFNKKQNWMK